MSTLEWIGIDKIINHHQEVPYRVLDRQYSFHAVGQHLNDNGSENMIIHGDNLGALEYFLNRLLFEQLHSSLPRHYCPNRKKDII